MDFKDQIRHLTKSKSSSIMKISSILQFSVFAIALFSCSSNLYYQILKTKIDDGMVTKDNALIYENEHCRITYNLWAEGGNVGFSFFNKSNQNVYLNLDQSFFVLNGEAHNYYRNRIFTHSSSSAASISRQNAASRSVTGLNVFDLLQTNRIAQSNQVGVYSSSERSVAYNEEKIVCIPPGSYKNISEYLISEKPIRDCGLLRRPSRKSINTVRFTRETSPLVFSNLISFNIGNGSQPSIVSNSFFISDVANYPEKEIFRSEKKDFCGELDVYPSRVFNKSPPDAFYIRYSIMPTNSQTFSH
jgi:hypothetical protein